MDSAHRTRIPGWAFVTILSLLPIGAQAGKLTGVSASPNPAQAGATVTITVQKSGSNCGFKINLGNGVIEGPFAFPSGNSRLLQRSYPQPGSFTIKIWGKKKGSKPACGGGEKTVQLTVQSGSSPGGSSRIPIVPPPGGFGSAEKPHVIQKIPVGPGPMLEKNAADLLVPAAKHPPAGFSLSCDAVPCVKDVRITPHGTWAEFEIITSQEASVQVHASTQPLTPSTLGSAPHFIMTFGQQNISKTKLMGLEEGRDYHYVVKAVSKQGVHQYASGKFSTAKRTVRVIVDKVVVYDDSDDLSAGDFTFSFSALGKKQYQFSVDIDSGDTYNPIGSTHSFVMHDVPDEFELDLFVFEDDHDAFGMTFSSVNDHHKKMISVGSAGLAEDAEWKTTIRATDEYDLKMYLTLQISYD